MDKKEAYKIVFEDLKQCGLFNGHYDARNRSDHYMYGISTVMECIAYGVDDSTGMNFETEFLKNLVDSEEKADKQRMEDAKNETHERSIYQST